MYGVIMAGGIGTRFWPRSRMKHPKQLLKILGNRTLIQDTIKRIEPIIPGKNIIIVSTISQIDEIKRQLPFIVEDNIIVEPKGKNTAPCIGLAALILKKIDPNAIMAVLPADHLIQQEQEFRKILFTAGKIASEKDSIVTIGINPTYPSTGYGYIQVDGITEKIDGIQVFKAKTFAEKPDINTAKRFLKSGDFLWNSGMFIWKVTTILHEIEESLPELYDGLLEIEKSLGTKHQDEIINKVYCQIKSISIDYGVMEHAKNVSVLKGDFGWNDIGSWEEVYKISAKDKNGNVCKENDYLKETQNCLINVPDKLVATIGVNDLIIVEVEDALLICPRNRAQNVKELVEGMKRKELIQYL